MEETKMKMNEIWAALITKRLSPKHEKRVQSDHEQIQAEMERGEADPIKAYQLGFMTGAKIGMEIMADDALREALNRAKAASA